MPLNSTLITGSQSLFGIKIPKTGVLIKLADEPEDESPGAEEKEAEGN